MRKDLAILINIIFIYCKDLSDFNQVLFLFI